MYNSIPMCNLYEDSNIDDENFHTKPIYKTSLKTFSQ